MAKQASARPAAGLGYRGRRNARQLANGTNRGERDSLAAGWGDAAESGDGSSPSEAPSIKSPFALRAVPHWSQNASDASAGSSLQFGQRLTVGPG
ncbi:MAG TPA: hypothetical protein VMW62_14820 [Chloroflexota bacterium]|nr:hypothetical protein [Chloroflexota bacterium]